ncbi:MAG: alkaline phosphatase D family protein [Pseudomonadota bacterium]
MSNSLVFKDIRPWPNPLLERASIVGHTTADSCRIWVRVADLGDFTLLVYPSHRDAGNALFSGFKEVPYTGMAALPAWVQRYPFAVYDELQDTTCVIEVEGLEPATEYRYAVFGAHQDRGRIVIGRDYEYRFRTLPAQAGVFSFGFYSCHMPYKVSLFGRTSVVNEHMWDCLNEVLERHYAQDLRFVIAGGDQVYADGVKTLDIWKLLNARMAKSGGELSPSYDEMVSWYRDIYHGYWGFPGVRKAFAGYPTYMIWDDHEIADGWGSFLLGGGKDELDERFPERRARKLSRRDCLELRERMQAAASRVYREYQHSHNPDSPADGGDGTFDYHFVAQGAAFYVLDGRGCRDINRRSRRVLGVAQFNRFRRWLEALQPRSTPFLFVVSTVPVLHMLPVLVNADDNVLADVADLQDDLRDAWEHEKHDSERKALVRALFAAAERGIRVCILSGDVHTSAAFRMIDARTGAVIYQLTSSAITYNKPRALGWLLGHTVAEAGQSPDGYRFERLALYTDSNFSLLQVDPVQDMVTFRLYGEQKVSDPDEREQDRAVTHSLASIECRFSPRA